MKKSELRQLIREEIGKLNEIDSTKLKEMQDFLKPFLTGLTKVKSPKYPDSVFYKKDGEVIFELDSENSKDLSFWVDYNKIWRIFYLRFGLNYTQTQSFIKPHVENTLKLHGVTPKSDFRVWRGGWSNKL